MAIIGNVIVNLIAKTKGFRKSFKGASRSMKFFKRTSSKIGGGLMILGKALLKMATSVVGFVVTIFKKAFSLIQKLAKIGTVAIATMFAVAIAKGASFEKTMSRVKAISGATGKEFESIKALAEKMGETTVFTAKQSAEAMSFLALAGFETNEIISAMPATLDLAAAGQLEVAESADIAAKLMAGMGIEAKDLRSSVDVLTKAFTSSNTNLVQLGEAFQFVGPVARTLNKSVEEITSALMLLGDAGLQGSMGGTALRGVLARLAGGTPAVAKQIRKLGITVMDASGNMLPLANIVDQFNRSMGDMSSTERAAKVMQMFGLRAGPGFAVLLNEGGDALREYKALLEGAGGTAANIAAIQLNNLAGSFTLLKSKINATAISIYDQIEPALRRFVDNLGAWISENKKTIVFWAAVLWHKILFVFNIIKDFVSFMITDFSVGIQYGFDTTIAFAEVFATHFVKIMVAAAKLATAALTDAGRASIAGAFRSDAFVEQFKARAKHKRNKEFADSVLTLKEEGLPSLNKALMDARSNVPTQFTDRLDITKGKHEQGLINVSDATGRGTQNLTAQMLEELRIIKEELKNNVGMVH